MFEAATADAPNRSIGMHARNIQALQAAPPSRRSGAARADEQVTLRDRRWSNGLSARSAQLDGIRWLGLGVRRRA
jgi:hypothetical protein